MIVVIAVVVIIVELALIINEDASFLQIKRRRGVLTLCPMPGKVLKWMGRK